jgi:glyoxylase-like metal-dependent hydrolase (beta-lactamase superfamily II)/rhodanese-related sulfurtransferase
MLIRDLNPLGSSTRTWLLTDEATRSALIVDPVERHLAHYLDQVFRSGVDPVAVVDTHTHGDHVSGAPGLAARLGIPLVMHHQAPRGCVDRRVRHSEVIDVGNLPVRVLTTPGHTYDSISLAVEDALLAGDLLTLGPRGHGDEGCADVEAFADSIHMLEALSPATRVFGTHDAAGARPEPLLVALARAVASYEPTARASGASRMGTGVVAPTDGATFTFLRANSSCDSRARQSGASQSPAPTDPARLSPKDLAAALDSVSPPHVVDVRSPAEFHDDGLGSIPGSLLVPLDHLEAEAPNLRALGTPIVVSCRATLRSALGASILQRSGLASVSVLEGGILAWRAEGFEVDRGDASTFT